ncbi:aromatic-ring-hydroxylating dioxygenase subunit beta [Azospirillum sp. SYSU D00513]|uniref:aromatic-ring-hydroxylating dioxygenase subunit beta n=1 Tax=Azospirillum sp. SYSU D00513 TaxID=2812561 RepID=UPI001A975CA1|nr:aromatic-ring-hydroxylating dioxygenase subunit beta [Azospirillum sp. SYSU D00513]
MGAGAQNGQGGLPDIRSIERFLYREARLLDERRWSEWLALFAEDGVYWAPLTHDQPDWIDHASLFHEDALMRQVRARRLEEKRAWSQQPPTHTARIVGNVHFDEEARWPGPGPGQGPEPRIVVRSTFHVMEWRHDTKRLLGGFYTYHLLPEGESFRIALKRVDLIDREGAHEMLEVFL